MPEASATERQLARAMGRCIADFGLVQPGDRILVGISGGKDSYGLLHLLARLQRRAPVPFSLIAVHVDQGHPGYDGRPLEDWLRQRGFAYEILREDTYRVVTETLTPEQTYCALCSRLRRGILYTAAKRLGCSKVALGHHRDDAVETLLLNLSFNGSLSAMPARYASEDHGLEVIRPLIYAEEALLARFADEQRWPILPCNLCGSQDNLKRQQVKTLLQQLEALAPQVRQSMLAAMGNVRRSHLLERAGLSGASERLSRPSAPSLPGRDHRRLPLC